MNTPEPVVVGHGRYRIHRVRSGLHLCYQVEWQRNFRTLYRQRLRARDGMVLEFLSPPSWESSARLFADPGEAAEFAVAALDAEPVTSDLGVTPETPGAR